MNSSPNSAVVSFLDLCQTNGLDIYSCLTGTETKRLRRSSSYLAADAAEEQVLEGLASCRYCVKGTSALGEMLRSSKKMSHSEVYDAVYNEARSLHCNMARVLSTPDGYGRLPLFIAVKHSQPAAIDSFLHMRADVDAGNLVNGWSPLVLASWVRNEQAMNVLIKNGANVDHHANQGFTPLAAAALASCVKTCEILIAAGANATLARKLRFDFVSGGHDNAKESTVNQEFNRIIDSVIASDNLSGQFGSCDFGLGWYPSDAGCSGSAPTLAANPVLDQGVRNVNGVESRTWMDKLAALGGVICWYRKCI